MPCAQSIFKCKTIYNANILTIIGEECNLALEYTKKVVDTAKKYCFPNYWTDIMIAIDTLKPIIVELVQNSSKFIEI